MRFYSENLVKYSHGHIVGGNASEIDAENVGHKLLSKLVSNTCEVNARTWWEVLMLLYLFTRAGNRA